MADGAGLPGLAAVVSLLHRADWARLSLSGEVSGNDEPRAPGVGYGETVRTFRARPPLSPADSPLRLGDRGDPPRAWALRVAPGGRYRRESGPHAFGSDGVRAWQWYQDVVPDAEDLHPMGTVVPFATLLCPSWLLTGYELFVVGRVTACQRQGVRVTGIARPREKRDARSLSRLDVRYERIDAVIDAELGILLRCERSLDGASAADLLEFVSLDMGAQAHDAVFAPPPGSLVDDARRAGRMPARDAPSFSTVHPLLASPAAKTTIGKTVAGKAAIGKTIAGRAAVGKTIAGRAAVDRAAGALGTALKFTPFLKVKARQEDEIGEQMPDDDPPPVAAGSPVSDEILHLLYRSGGGVPRFTATLHTWMSGVGVLAGVPESAREMGIGGVGHLVDAVAAQADLTTHEVSTARIDGWYRYQIERVPPFLGGRHHGPTLIACNGRRYWEVREDRVSIDEPRPAPAQLADLADASWLLGCELSGGEAITAGGRAAYRLTVRGNHSHSELLGLGFLVDPGFPVDWAFSAVAVVDAEAGRIVRLTTYGNVQPAVRHELRDVSDDASPEGGWDFAFEAPAGLRVVRIGADDDRPLKDGEAAGEWPGRCRPGKRHRLGLR